MNHLKMALILGLVILSFNICAQGFHPKYDYIITRKNDTLKCKVRTSVFQHDYGNGYKYKLEIDTDYHPLTTENIKEFYMSKDSTTFVAVMLPGHKEERFVSLLERGKITLYEDIATVNNNSTLTFYASKNGAQLFDIKTNGVFGPTGASHSDRKKALTDMLSDNPPLLKNFVKEGDYDFDAIRNAINLYNFAAKN